MKRAIDWFVEWLRARDLRLLAVIAAIALLGWGFVELADEVGDMDTAAVDRAILLGLRTDGAADPVGPYWLERTMVNLSALGSGAVITTVLIVVCGYLWLTYHRRHAALIAVCALGTWLAMFALKRLFGRERPDFVDHLDGAAGLSFPSGHAMAATAIYLTIGALIARAVERRAVRIYVITVAVALALVVGFTRVYIGVHYPSDVLGGWAVGAAWALAVGVGARVLQQRGVVEPIPT